MYNLANMKVFKNKKAIYTTIASLLVLIVAAGAIFSYMNYEKIVYQQDETVVFDDFELNIDNVKTNDLEFSQLKDPYVGIDGEDDLKVCDTEAAELSIFDMLSDEERENRRQAKDCLRYNEKASNYLDAENEISQYLKNNNRLDIWYSIQSKSNSLKIENIDISIISPAENLQGKRFEHANFFEDEIYDRTRNEIEKGELTQDLKRSGVTWADIQKDAHEINLKIKHKDTRKTIQIKLNEN